MKNIRIATRKSPLALWQANYVAERLTAVHPGLEVEIVGLMTEGDQFLGSRLSSQGGKGLFLKELEISLLRNETDIAVHSMKDVPVRLPPGLSLSAFVKREDARDAFISENYNNLYALPKGARVGTASLRRTAQLKNAFPALEFIELRGNVNSRIKKLEAGEFDAIILAAAGLIRLDFASRIKQYIPPELCLPAVGQGVLGIETRQDDDLVKALIKPLNDYETQLCLLAERSMNAGLSGGCHVPIGGYATIENRKLTLKGLVGEPDGSRVLVSNAEAKLEHPIQHSAGVEVEGEAAQLADELGKSVAEGLLKQGADEILDSLYQNKQEGDQAVILTRQEQFLGNMKSILEALDFTPFHLPTIEVEPVRSSEVTDIFSALDQFTDIVFVSRNAVEIGMHFVNHHGGMPESCRVMTVGAETAKQLYRHGIDAMFPQHGTGAEALLGVGQLTDLTGQNILLVRGDGGLDWPAQEMQSRGAQVQEVRCYKQKLPENSLALMQKCASDKIGVAGVFVHSANSAVHLIDLAKQKYPELLYAILVAGSQRIATKALELGWRGEIRVADSPSNKHMMICFSQPEDSSV